jgi:hypothetical protein
LKYFSAPIVGDIVWCLFHESLGQPGSKPRPALIIELGSDANNNPVVTVIYGTMQKLNGLYPSEFKIEKSEGASFALSGLAYNTKFDFNHQVKLPFCDTWFGIYTGKQIGNQPKIGVLAPNLIARATVAYKAKT